MPKLIVKKKAWNKFNLEFAIILGNWFYKGHFKRNAFNFFSSFKESFRKCKSFNW